MNCSIPVATPTKTNMLFHSLFVLASVAVVAQCQNIVLTNDDGWATAQIRAQDDALNAAGFNVRGGHST